MRKEMLDEIGVRPEGQLQYSIVRFVPDSVRGEFINVGVLVTDSNKTWQLKWVKDLSRAKGIGDADSNELLEELIERMETRVFEYGDRIDADWINREANHQQSLFQITPARPIAPMTIEEGLDLVFSRFILE